MHNNKDIELMQKLNQRIKVHAENLTCIMTSHETLTECRSQLQDLLPQDCCNADTEYDL